MDETILRKKIYTKNKHKGVNCGVTIFQEGEICSMNGVISHLMLVLV